MKAILVLVAVVVLTIGIAYAQQSSLSVQCWETDAYRLKASGAAMSQLILFTDERAPLSSVLIGRHSLSTEPESDPGAVVEIQYLGTDDAGATLALRENRSPTNAQRAAWHRRIKPTAPATFTVDVRRYVEEIAGLPFYFLENHPAQNFRIPRPSRTTLMRISLPTEALGFRFAVGVFGSSASIFLRGLGEEPWQRCR